MKIFFGALLFVLGAAMGSFVCCQAWRIRKKDKSKRSHCMNCNYALRWRDNIPILSWLWLRGKCRRCKEKIGITELVAELALALVFLIVGINWPLNDVWNILGLVTFLSLMSALTLLFIYDAKWGELPMSTLLVCICLALFSVFLQIRESLIANEFLGNLILEYLGALMLLPGFYYLLYKISKEKWVGAGDWILCLPLALVLGKFWLAFFCLFGANCLGSIVMLPLMKIQKKKMNTKISFGPFLIIAFVAVFLLQEYILSFMSV